MIKLAVVVLLGAWLYLKVESRFFRRTRDVQWPPWPGR